MNPKTELQCILWVVPTETFLKPPAANFHKGSIANSAQAWTGRVRIEDCFSVFSSERLTCFNLEHFPAAGARVRSEDK